MGYVYLPLERKLVLSLGELFPLLQTEQGRLGELLSKKKKKFFSEPNTLENGL